MVNKKSASSIFVVVSKSNRLNFSLNCWLRISAVLSLQLFSLIIFFKLLCTSSLVSEYRNLPPLLLKLIVNFSSIGESSSGKNLRCSFFSNSLLDLSEFEPNILRNTLIFYYNISFELTLFQR